MQIEKIKIDNDKYPNLLRNIQNPPKQIYVLGNSSILNDTGIAIIGSRNCTDAGKKIARNFANQLSSVGICINSGMAKGIDSQAHMGALEYSGKTIAVLGCGLNNIYPKENEKLFYQIINNGGAVISEYDKDVKPESKRFIERNRIVSGMSIGVLVVEAGCRSGTSITAQFAKKQGKPVFCIPHDISEKLGIGTNKLIQKGAKCAVNYKDILKEYKDLNINLDTIINQKKKLIDTVPEEYKDIYDLISEEPLDINYICRNLKKNIMEVSAGLTILELEGYITQLAGNKFIRQSIP